MEEVIKLELERNKSAIDMFDKNRVTGRVTIIIKKDGKPKFASLGVLEHRNYIFPEGVYRLRFEDSPKFKRKLWEFKDIKNRSEIKFHTGAALRHTIGCPLLSHKGLSMLHSMLNQTKDYFIHVKNI